METQLCADGEKVGVVRIKVSQPRLHASAVMANFFGIDKLLEAWSARLDGKFDCQFEIAWHDGRTISGTYRFRRKGRSRPALMSFVRASVEDECANPARPCALVGLALQPRVFLERYELDDFGQIF